MEYYRRHMRHGSAAGKAHHYLVLGPWDHAGTRIPEQEFGGLEFGDAAMFDAFQLDRDWYRWAMGEGERPAFLLDRVTYFVAGANEWKGAASLEDIGDAELVYHLQSDGPADSLYHSGSLVAAAATSADVDAYVYDPLDTTKAGIEVGDGYIVDTQELQGTDGDGLIYHSAPFKEPTEITRYARFEAWIELDVPDTDISLRSTRCSPTAPASRWRAGGASPRTIGETRSAEPFRDVPQARHGYSGLVIAAAGLAAERARASSLCVSG